MYILKYIIGLQVFNGANCQLLAYKTNLEHILTFKIGVFQLVGRNQLLGHGYLLLGRQNLC